MRLLRRRPEPQERVDYALIARLEKELGIGLEPEPEPPAPEPEPPLTAWGGVRGAWGERNLNLPVWQPEPAPEPEPPEPNPVLEQGFQWLFGQAGMAAYEARQEQALLEMMAASPDRATREVATNSLKWLRSRQVVG